MRFALFAGTAVVGAGLFGCLPLHAQSQPPATAAAPPSTTTPTPPSAPAPAATAAPATPPGTTAATQPDPIVATVAGRPIHLSDVSDAAQSLPDQMRQLPPATLFPMLLDQLIDREALVVAARNQGLEKDPTVQLQMRRADDTVLQNALVKRDVGPLVTEEALKARYDATIAGKPGEEEVDARHILVPTKADAEKLIADLDKGADFATLAKEHSTDPAGAQGGDLGFFKKGDMLPEFSAAAFALQPGQYTKTPIQTRYGWHVIQVVARRRAPTPSFADVRDQLRQQVIEESLQKVIGQALQGLQVVRFNPDGTPLRATDHAAPPDANAPTTAPGGSDTTTPPPGVAAAPPTKP